MGESGGHRRLLLVGLLVGQSGMVLHRQPPVWETLDYVELLGTSASCWEKLGVWENDNDNGKAPG